MRYIWLSAAVFVLGLVITAFLPMYSADGEVGVVAPWLVWLGWILLLVGVVGLALSWFRR